MKLKNILLLITIMSIFSGCSTNGTPEAQKPDLQQIQAQQQSPAQLKIIDIKTPVKAGDRGSIKIHGQAGVTYTITSSFLMNGKRVSASEAKTAGRDGTVSWEWDIGEYTDEGTYPISVSGAEKNVIEWYTVTK